MKKRLFCLILAILLTLSVILPASAQAVGQEPDAFNGYLVHLSDSPGQLRLSPFGTDDGYEMVSDNLCLVEDLEEAQALTEFGMAQSYEPNYILALQEDAPSYTPTQWNLLAVKAQAAWSHVNAREEPDMRGDGVTVAVIDSGVYAEHPDFKQGNILANYDLANTGGRDDWHGTFVAGVIAAQVNNGLGSDGVSPDVAILPICVTKGGNTDTATVIMAIDYAIAQRVDIINLSIGGIGTAALEEACLRAADAGIIVVAAAGNYKTGESQSASKYMYPASYDCVISVSACKQSSGTAAFDSAYSYYNDKITVAAPGSDVVSLYTDGGTATKSGTSFAAPVVSAIAAMAKERNSAISPAVFTSLLCASADDLGVAGYDQYYGNGFVNIQSFAAMLDQSYPIAYQLGDDASFAEGTAVPERYTIASMALALPTPIRAGYHFLGWYEVADFSGAPVTAIPSGSIGDRVYYARWEKDAPLPLTGKLALAQTGPVKRGDTLSLSADSMINGEIVKANSADYGLQWLRDGQPITDATGLTYTAVSKDRGCRLSLTVTAKGEGYHGAVASDMIGVSTETPALTLTAIPGNGQVELRWAVNDDGGSALTRFTVYRDSEPGLTLAHDSTRYTFTDLKNGSVCRFRVEAYNTALDGTPQFGSAEVLGTPASPPENGGGGGGLGVSGYTTPSITIEKKPDQPTVASMDLTATVDENAVASVTITETQVKELIDAAKKDAENKNNNADGIGVALNIGFGADGKIVIVKLEEKVLTQLVKEGAKRFDVATPLVAFSFDGAAIQAMKSQASGAVSIAASPVTKLTQAAKALIGHRPIYDLTMSYQKNGKTDYVSDFKNGTVTLGLPYRVASEEQADCLRGVYVGKDGRPQLLDHSSYANGSVIFSGNSLSTYGVGYKAPVPAFTDTEKHWAKDDIDFVASRGLISGIGAKTFTPDTAITRGDFLMALGRLSGADVMGFKASGFTDVISSDPAMPYIEWAVKNNIVQGIGNHQFGPDQQITRQDMAMQNYAKATGYQLPVSVAAATFSDGEKTAPYAKDTVTAIQQAGIMQGRGSNSFDPQGSATRAEAATILRRFVELVIDEGAARGWVQNDAGQWAYIGENGKAVTGWLTLEDDTYYFTPDGYLVSCTWLQIEGKWYYFYPDGFLAKSTKVDGYEIDENGVRIKKQ